MPLRITVELIPGGNEAKKETLGVMAIERVSAVEEGTGDYRIIEMPGPSAQFYTRAFFLKSIQRDMDIFQFLSNIFAGKKNATK